MGMFVLFISPNINAQSSTGRPAPYKNEKEIKDVRSKQYKTLPQQTHDQPQNAKEIWLQENQIYTVVSEMPEYLGGNNKMFEFINQNLRYPVKAKEMKKEGKVIADVLIEKDGAVSEVKILKDGVGYGAAEETERVLRLMPKWKPGMEGGKPVRVSMKIPIYFKL